MAGQLAVWLEGMNVASIIESRRGPRLQYTADALREYGPGVPLLSVSLPLRSEPYAQGVTRAYLEGLLPEGEPRLTISSRLRIEPADTYALIAALGHECAGAVIIQPDSDPPPDLSQTLTAQRLNEEEVRDLIDRLPLEPLGVDSNTRLSLAGVQDKLLLTRLPEGGWGKPVDGTPSTHIIKPASQRFPTIVENEAFCMRLASHLGLKVAETYVATFAGRVVLVVKRYDREIGTDGTVRRIHQEDFCQALSRLPSEKYQDKGGPSLKEIAEILGDVGPLDSLQWLLRAVLVNVLIGNSDAHGKNFSLLHEPRGTLHPAPLYDLVSTRLYKELTPHMAMKIDEVERIDRVSLLRVLNEARSWGLQEAIAQSVAKKLLDELPHAVELAAQDVPSVPVELPELILAQRDLLLRADAA